MDEGMRSQPDRNSRFVTAAVTTAATALFVATGGAVLSLVVRQWMGRGVEVDRILLIAMLLNIALILFGWRRWRAMADEVVVLTADRERVTQLARQDTLTRLVNRRTLAEEGGALIADAARGGMTSALMMIDLDRFKSINDLHGHAVGDALLRQIADRIAATVPVSALAARLGGDEFACLFPYPPGRIDIVDQVAERTMAVLSRPFMADGVELSVGASIGLARSDRDGDAVASLLRAADVAMYAAKKAGQGGCVWFEPPMEQALADRQVLEHALRRAIPAGDIVPYFEQQIDLASGRLVGFEVLARWTHASGVITPDGFLAIADETGLTPALSMSVMRQALVAAREWDSGLTIAVNLSPTQLRDTWLAQKIIKLLAETGFPASRLEVEITERSLLDNLALAQSTMGSLKNQGVRLALDDFGTGYSSLAHLRALPFDTIKIDRSIIGTIDDAENAAVVSAIVRLGESLNLPITAEGVERADVAARLTAIGCGKAQGYLYSRPLTATQARVLVAERGLLTGAAASRIDVGVRRTA